MKITATVYTGPNCRACVAVIAWLKRQGVEVEERSYEAAPFQVWSLPTIVIGDEVLTGFNPMQLRRVLRDVK